MSSIDQLIEEREMKPKTSRKDDEVSDHLKSGNF